MESPYPPRTAGYVDCLTPVQKEALKQLCKELPDALEGLTGDALILWGVSLASLNTPGVPAVPTRAQSVVLLKFLRARQFNVSAALAMLVACLKWRRDFDVVGLAAERFPQLAGAGQLSGRDRAGNPVTYNYYSSDVDLAGCMGGPGGMGTFVRWRVRLMEQAVAALDFEAGVEHVTQVHDYSGASIMKMDPNMKAASRQIIKLFQDNYPEMLSAKLFLNVPYVMEFVFGLFSSFSDAATRAKFTMASPGRARAVLLQYVDPVQLPARFGGFLETCSVPPSASPSKAGGSASFSRCASKQVTLKPGESHVVSDIVGADSQVAWGFVSAGRDVRVRIGFRPRDNAEAAAVAAGQPEDYVQGASPRSSNIRDAQQITESHSMTLAKDAGSGRLVLGCPGEVTMTLENTDRSVGFFSAPTTAVHYLLAGSTPAAASLRCGGSSCSSLAASASGHENGAGAGPGYYKSKDQVFSYKSLGCASLASNDLGEGPGAEDAPGGGGVPFETVTEGDESGAMSPHASSGTGLERPGGAAAAAHG